MSRKLFTEREITLCTYAALYSDQDFGGRQIICLLEKRPLASIDMKIQNIASMLDEEGIKRYSQIPPLTGLTTGMSGRRTNWNWVQPLTRLSKPELLRKCHEIVALAR